jgi:hypothetical protein
LIAADLVDVLGEYVVGARLPLTRTSGPGDLEFSLGVWSGQTVLSISLTPHDSTRSRPAQGVLLITGRPGLRWALEIDAATGFVEVERISAGGASWRRPATLSDGRTAPYIDVSALMRELAPPVAARQAG